MKQRRRHQNASGHGAGDPAAGTEPCKMTAGTEQRGKPPARQRGGGVSGGASRGGQEEGQTGCASLAGAALGGVARTLPGFSAQPVGQSELSGKRQIAGTPRKDPSLPPALCR